MVTGDDYKGNESTFEPSDDKGLLARALLYMDTCYDDMALVNNNYSLSDVLFADYGLHGNKEEIISWAQSYDVNYHEYQHNQVVYSYQGNRNPYVDFPNLIDYVYGDKQSQAGSIEDLIQESTYLTLSLDKHEYKNLAIQNVKYEYQVGETITSSDIGNAYIVYTDLTTSSIEINSLDISLNNYTFTSSDIGTKDIKVTDGKTSVSYQISIVSANPMDACEYLHSFIKSDGSADSTKYKDVNASNGPVTIDSSGIDLVYTVASGKRGTGSKEKGVGFGSGTSPIGKLTIESASSLTYQSKTSVNAIYVEASNANGGSFTLSVYVGDTLIDSYTSSVTTSTIFAFEVDPALEGKLKIEFDGIVKTLYVKNIAIDFN